ncbi:MAG TPA: hypothetical protein VFK59_03080 [Actinomycetota bacterium]|nr:hypothetical protein [Actinomycetota bacterium]
MPNHVVELYRPSSDVETLRRVADRLAAGMRTVIWFGALVFAIVGALAASSLRSTQATDVAVIRPNVDVTGATEQLAMVRWAVERFEIAGLEPPVVEIAFHLDLSRCGGHLGFARQGEVDLCTTLVDPIARRALLHEMGHIWLDQNLSDLERERFLEVRGLHAWNDSSDTWALRGYEQGAEIMAWALGERIRTPQIPDNEPIQLARGFELLTGFAPPAYTDASNEQTPSTHKGMARTANWQRVELSTLGDSTVPGVATIDEVLRVALERAGGPAAADAA